MKDNKNIEGLGKPCFNCGKIITKKNYKYHYPVNATMFCKDEEGNKVSIDGNKIEAIKEYIRSYSDGHMNIKKLKETSRYDKECPECGKTIQYEKGDPKDMKCPKCGTFVNKESVKQKIHRMKESLTSTYDRVKMLEEAQDKIHEACELIRNALKGTSNSNRAEAYIIAHLENWADGDNPYDSTAIPRLIEDLEEEDEEDEFDEEEGLQPDERVRIMDDITDPLNRQGMIGLVVKHDMSNGEVTVRFTDGVVGLYDEGALELIDKDAKESIKKIKEQLDADNDMVKSVIRKLDMANSRFMQKFSEELDDKYQDYMDIRITLSQLKKEYPDNNVLKHIESQINEFNMLLYQFKDKVEKLVGE